MPSYRNSLFFLLFLPFTFEPFYRIVIVRDKEIDMKVSKAKILDKLASWSQEDWDGVMEVWVESNSDLSMNQFAINIAAQNVLFDILKEES